MKTLSEHEICFHLNCKKDYSFWRVLHILGNPSSAIFCVGNLVLSCYSEEGTILLLFIFWGFLEGGREVDTEHRKLSQGIITAAIQAFVEESDHLEKKNT